MLGMGGKILFDTLSAMQGVADECQGQTQSLVWFCAAEP